MGHLDVQRLQSLGPGVVSDQASHAVAPGDQRLGQIRADESVGAGEQDPVHLDRSVARGVNAVWHSRKSRRSMA